MKKIITLISFLIIAQFSIAQQIDSILVNPILCNAGDTTVIVYTNVTSTFEYFNEYELIIGGTTYWIQVGNTDTVNSPNTSFTITNLFATTWRVTIQSLGGGVVFDIDTFMVNQPGPITPYWPYSLTGSVSCFGGCDGTVQVFITGGTPDMTGGTPTYNYAWLPSQPNTDSLTGLCADTYTVNVTDDNGCIYSGHPNLPIPISLIVSQPAAALSASITGQSNFNGFGVSCDGGNNGEATAAGADGTAPYGYSWNTTPSATLTAQVTGLSAGTYICTITDANGCVTTTTVTITEPPVLTVTSTDSTNVNCFGGNNGTATVNVSGGTPGVGGYTYSWIPGGINTNPATGLTEGTYTCIVTDANGCTTVSNVTVTEPTAALNITSIVATNVSCFGGNDGTITVTASGGTVDYQYRINGGAYTPATSGSHTFTTLSFGSHTIEVLDANNCPFITTVTVSQPDVLSVTTNIDSISCNGLTDGSIIVTASGGTSDYQYRINGGAYTPATPGSHTFITLSAGSHTIDVLDANNCSTQVIEDVFEPNPITVVDTNLVMVSCNGDSTGTATVNLSGGTPGYTYSWNTNPITVWNQTTPTATGLWAGTLFTCTVTDANGCPYSLNPISVTITEPAAALTIGGTDSTIIICNGDSTGTATVINVSGGTPGVGGYTYSWNTNPIQTTPTATGLSGGLYTVTVSDSNSCSTSENVTVTESLFPLIVTPSSSNVSCNGVNNGMATVSITGGVPGYTSSWSTGQTGTTTISTISGLYAGSYTDTITDTWGCVHLETFIITEPLPITVTFVSPANDVLCNGDSTGTATVNVSGGTPGVGGYTYSWNTDPITVWNQTTPTATGLWAGLYTVTVLDSIACASQAAGITIQEPTAITAIENISHVSCNGGNDGSIDLSVSGGTPYTIGTTPYTYLWSNGQTTSIATGLTEGLYTVEITDTNLCKQLYVFTITEPAVPLSATLTLSNYNGYNISCNGGNDGVLTANVVGGTPPYTYQWPGPQNSQSFINLVAGTYICYITDTNGCITSATATLLEPSPITITTSSNPASCFGFSDGTLTVTPTGGAGNYTYAWSNGQSTPTAINLVAGAYTVWVTDANGCAEQAGPLTVGQPLQISAILNTTHITPCNGDSNGVITVSGVGGTTPPYTYLWSNGNTMPMNINLTAGPYWVTITDGVGPPGCHRTFYDTITEPTPITANLFPTNVSVNGASNGSISVNASGGVPCPSGYTYTWTGSNGYTNTGATINSLPVGVYTVTITDCNGCSQIFSQVITQPNCNVTISATYTDPICPDEMGVLDWLNSGGLPPYTNTLTHSSGLPHPSANGHVYNAPTTAINLYAGVWALVVIDAAGCPAIFNISVTTIDSISVTISKTDATCFGYNNGTASATVSGGTAPYIIDWGMVNPNQLVAGSYNILITDFNGCIYGPRNYTIGQPDSLVIDSFITTDVSCTPGNDGTATVYASGGTLPYLYSWSNSNGQTTQTAQNLLTGTYTVNVTDANLCPAGTSVVIVAADPLIVDIDVDSISCNNGSNGSLTANIISGAPPFSYSWVDLSNPSVVISSNATVSNLSSGAYSLTVTDNNGCVDQVNKLLPSTSVMSFSLLATPMTSSGANNGSINIINGNLGLPFNCNGYWTGPNGFTATTTFTSISPTILTSLSPGIYTLIITDPNGCTLTLQAVIPEIGCNVQVIPTVIQPLCFGDSGTFTWTNSGGSGSYDNTIIDLSTTLPIHNSNTTISSQILSQGSYTLYVEDSYGCYNIVNISIQAPNPLVPTITPSPTSCYQGNDGSVSISVSGGTPDPMGNYTIDYGVGVNPLTYSPGIYVVDITDVNGCPTYPDTLVFEIEEPNDILVTYSTTSVSCFGGTDGTASTAVTGGTYPYFYLWAPTGDTTQSVNNLVAGTYFVTVNDINGCSSTLGPTEVTVTQPNSITNITFSNTNPTCYGAANGMATANAVGGGTPPYHYLWSNGWTTNPAQGLSGGVYTVIVTDANGCITTNSTTIIEPDEILPIIAIIEPSCNGDSNGEAHLTITGGTGPFAVLWGIGSTNYYSINGLSAGTFSVTVTETSNPFCYTTQIFVVGEPDILQLSTSVINATSCFNGGDGEVSVSVTGGTTPYTYVWTDVNNTTISTTSSAINLSAGYYTVAVIDDNGCSDSSGILVGSPNQIAPNFTVDSVSCNGGSDGSALVTPTGGTSPYTYIWNGSVTASLAANYTGLNATTTYFVLIVDANGCTGSFQIDSIPQPAPMQYIPVSTNPSCYGYSDGEINITSIVGGVAPFTYLWSNAQMGNSCSNLSAGNYSVIVIDNNMCTDTSNTLAIVDPPELIVTILPPVSFVSCHDSTNGALSATAVGGTPPLSYAWSSGDSLQQTDSLSAGIYTATVTDGNGCSGSETITLSNPAPITFTYSVSDYNGYNVACYGNNNATISVNASSVNGINNSTYIWDTGLNDSIITSIGAGTYVVSVTDSNNCGGTETIIVNEPDSLSLLTSSTATSCNNSSDGVASVNVSGGVSPYTYIWNDPSSQTTTTASNLVAGAYTVWVTDVNSCNSSATISVSQPSTISSTLTITSNYNGYAISCHGSSDATVTVSASTGGSPGGYTYSTDAINYSPVSTFTSLSAGTFNVWTKDINGCTGDDNILITSPSVISPNITLVQNETCIGDANGQVYLAITGGAPSYTCLWNTGSTSPLLAGLSAGTYSVTVTGSNLCTGTESINLIVDHELFTTITTTPVTCTGGSDGTALVTLDPTSTGTPPYNYLWNIGATTAFISGLAGGIYWVTVTDSNGCNITDTDTIVESANNLIIGDFDVINLDCFGDSDGSITVTASGGTGAVTYTYLWNDPSSQITATASNLVAGTYTVWVTDANGCTIIDSSTVTQPLQLIGVFTGSDISCFDKEDGSINTTISGGIAPYIYNWTGPNGFSNTTNNISGLDAGSYILVVTDDSLCNYSNTIIIDEPDHLAAVHEKIEPLCFGGMDGEIKLLVMGGTSPFSAIFGLASASNTPPSDSIIFAPLPAGGDSVYITDANGCEHVFYVNLTQPPLLVIDSHSEINPTCYDYSDGSATFSGTGGTPPTGPYSYQVLDASGSVVGNSSTLSDGAYDYLITDDNGCTATLSFTITQPDEIIITQNTITNVDCFGDSTGSILVNVQNAVEPYQALWTGGYIGNSITNLSEGMYTATVRDDNNCWSTDSFYVGQNDAVAINYSTQNASCLTVADGMIFVNSFSGGTAPYSVYNNGNLHTQNEHVSTTIDALFTGTHSLLITDANNCEFTAQIILDFDGDYNCIVVPIIISPNMDGTNDTWKPILDLSTDIEVSILNRWGKLVYYYSGNSIGFEWDGLSTDNDKLPSMDYYYIIKFNNVNYLDKTGVITLIR